MKKAIVMGISVLFLFSCNNSTQKATTDETGIEFHHEDHHHGDISEVLELNDGNKWVVNEEMKPFVTNGEDLVNLYISEKRTDHKALVEKLKDQNNQLIKNCTMDGKSHDELHKWLHPHLELVELLGQETDEAKANKLIAKLQESYQEYHNFFN